MTSAYISQWLPTTQCSGLRIELTLDYDIPNPTKFIAAIFDQPSPTISFCGK
jgi:hypothetical protein